MKNKTTMRQRYTRRHRNSPNYARWFEVVNWASWISFGLGWIMFIVGLGLLGSSNARVHDTDATIVWAIGLGIWVISIIFDLVLIWIDDDYESQQQSLMMNSVANISPEEWQKIGNNMDALAKSYQLVNKANKDSSKSPKKK